MQNSRWISDKSWMLSLIAIGASRVARIQAVGHLCFVFCTFLCYLSLENTRCFTSKEFSCVHSVRHLRPVFSTEDMSEDLILSPQETLLFWACRPSSLPGHLLNCVFRANFSFPLFEVNYCTFRWICFTKISWQFDVFLAHRSTIEIPNIPCKQQASATTLPTSLEASGEALFVLPISSTSKP